MSFTGDYSIPETSWQTRFFTNAVSMSEVRKGICELDSDSILLRAGSQSQDIHLEAITDIINGSPPESFADEFDQVFGVKFTDSGNSRLCFIKYDADYANLFEHKLFAEVIDGARGVIEYGAIKGGQQTDATSQQVKGAVKPDRVIFNSNASPKRTIQLGDIVNIQTGSRTVGEAKRDVIKVDHMENETQVTTYLSLIETRIQHLLNRYLRKEYAQLQADLSDTEVSESETELVVGYYTTQDLEQTMQTLTNGNKYEFESIYEQALNHGLVTHPDDGVDLTQKGKMLANTELAVVNT
jgi:helix-turn-helix protein